LIAGRELRDRGARKEYAEPTSDEDFDDDDDNDDDDEEPDAADHVTDHDDDEDHEPPQRLTRRITLRLKSTAFQTMSQGSQQPGSNGTKHNGDDEDEDAPADDDPPAAVESELVEQVVEVRELIKLDDDDDDDDEGGPRLLTRRVTRQQSVSQRDPVPERPSHGRKGVARQNRSSEKTNGDRKSPPDRDRRSSIRSRLRKQMRRSSREQSKKKQPSDSEFEADEDDPADDDVSLGSGDRGIVDDGTEEDYSSAPRAKRSRKPPPPPRRRSRRSRNVSDESVSDRINDLEDELREIGAEIPHRPRQLRPTERMNYFIPPPPGKDDIFLPPSSTRKRPGTGRGFGGFGGDFSNMGIGDRFRGITGLGTAGGADDSSDSVCSILLLLTLG
jgi:hypothetical protein